MKIQININHNYYEENPLNFEKIFTTYNIKKTGNEKKVKSLFSPTFELKLKNENLSNIQITKFKKKRYFDADEESLILRLYSKENIDGDTIYFIQTGLFAGILYYKNCQFNIETKYGNSILKRMLNFVNDIYIDTTPFNAIKDKNNNQFKFIISYLFIQSLEKAAILGLPQEYISHKLKSNKVRGQIDINQYIKENIPFKGMLTSKYNERKYVQEIIDVLYVALKKIETDYNKSTNKKISKLSNILKQQYSGKYVKYETIQKAKNHQSINNPIYSNFKTVLNYAEIILLNQDMIPNDKKTKSSTMGYLFDVSELFEVYLEKLLRRNFENWEILAQEELKIYPNQFYSRSIFPDLVMKHKVTGKVIVFDAKFKNMNFSNNDLDRMDLHQIHSYSAYYNSNLLACGLLYPLNKDINTGKSYSTSLFGNSKNNIHFIIDGIEIPHQDDMEKLIKNEKSFINRLKTEINKMLKI